MAKSLTVWSKTPLLPEDRSDWGEEESNAKEFVNTQERRGKPKPFCGQQCEQDFQHAQGLLLNVFFSCILSLSMQLLPRKRVREMWCILKCFASQMGFIFIQGQFCWLTGKHLVLKLDLCKSFAFHLLHYTSAWITGLPRWLLSITFKYLTWAKWLIWHFM